MQRWIIDNAINCGRKYKVASIIVKSYLNLRFQFFSKRAHQTHSLRKKFMHIFIINHFFKTIFCLITIQNNRNLIKLTSTLVQLDQS